MTLDDLTQEVYIGDAVYASFDGYQIWLRTGDGNDNRIALEPNVLDALMRYVGDLNAKITAYTKEQHIDDSNSDTKDP